MTKLLIEETEVVPLLTRMKLPRFALLEILSSVAGERANVRDGFDPPSATGYETWRWGVRFMREHKAIAEKGWLICEKDQVSGIVHPELNIKLAVLPTDKRTGTTKTPKNVTEKGPATCKMINANSAQDSFDFVKPVSPPPDLWFLCLYFCDAYIAAEISRPSFQLGGIVQSYSDRIVIAKPFEIPGIRKRHAVPEDFAEVERPVIRRKAT